MSDAFDEKQLYCDLVDVNDGSFDFDLSNGKIVFRLTSSYKNSTLSEELFEYMIMVAAATIDIYNDRFFMIAKGMLTIQQFIESKQNT